MSNIRFNFQHLWFSPLGVDQKQFLIFFALLRHLKMETNGFTINLLITYFNFFKFIRFVFAQNNRVSI